MKKTNFLSIASLLVTLSMGQASAFSFTSALESAFKSVLPFLGLLCMLFLVPVFGSLAMRMIGQGRYLLKAGIVIAVIGLEIVIPMGMPYGVGANYRDFWDKRL